MRRVAAAIAALVAGPPAASPLLASPAAALELGGEAIQGGLLVGRAPPGSAVTLDGRAVALTADGEFVLGFGRDAARATLEVVAPGAPRETRTLEIAPRKFDVQRIDGLPQAKVTPDPAALERIRREGAELAAARARSLPEPLYRSGWIWPATGPVSGIYGSQRILNGEPRAPHWGVDVAAPAGAPVVAPADGVVALVQTDNFLTGMTLLLDHGFGVSSVYAHLSAVDVAPGRRVRRGERIGAVGATGRVTGAHLHWGLNWFEVRLDPALLVPPMAGQ